MATRTASRIDRKMKSVSRTRQNIRTGGLLSAVITKRSAVIIKTNAVTIKRSAAAHPSRKTESRTAQKIAEGKSPIAVVVIMNVAMTR